MSSTETRLRTFYVKELVPVASAIRKRGGRFLSGATEEAASWYEPPISTPDIIEFEPADFGSALAEMWREQGNPELAELAGRLAALARELEQQGDQREDLSPFMYVMF